ncbi:hypothetical protein GCM10009630_56700 [Kribbella jejuensis]
MTNRAPGRSTLGDSYLPSDEMYDDVWDPDLHDELPPMSRVEAFEWQEWAGVEQDEAERVMLRLKAPAWVFLPPGAELAAALEELRPQCESPVALIEAMKAAARIESWAAAIKNAVMASFVRQRKAQASEIPRPTQIDSSGRPIDPERSWAAEIAAALHLAPTTASRHIETALHLTSTLTATHTALRCGALTLSKALAISEATRSLPTDAARAVEAHVLRRAPGQTHKNLNTSLRRQVAKHTTTQDADNHRAALADRTCKIVPLPDGMAGLWVVHTAPKIQQMWIVIQAMADLSKRPTPPNTATRPENSSPPPPERPPSRTHVNGHGYPARPTRPQPTEATPKPETTPPTEHAASPTHATPTSSTRQRQSPRNPDDTSQAMDAIDALDAEESMQAAHAVDARHAGNATRAGNACDADNAGEAGQARNAGHTRDARQAGHIGQAERIGHIGGTTHGENGGEVENAGKAERAGNATRDENAWDADNPGEAGHARNAEDAGEARDADESTGSSDWVGSAESDRNVRLAPQRRADVIADLFEHMLHNGLDWLGRRLPDQHRRRPHIEVLVPITTLLGVDDEPCELTGYGPIPAEMARHIATDGTWRRLLTDPTSGAVLEASTTRHDPGALVTETLLARHPVCAWPGCDRISRECDRDHAIPFARSGQTTLTGMIPYCEYHHVIKDTPTWGWNATPHPDGSITLTTPTGHRYTTVPPARGPIAHTPTPPPPQPSPSPTGDPASKDPRPTPGAPHAHAPAKTQPSGPAEPQISTAHLLCEQAPPPPSAPSPAQIPSRQPMAGPPPF